MSGTLLEHDFFVSCPRLDATDDNKERLVITKIRAFNYNCEPKAFCVWSLREFYQRRLSDNQIPRSGRDFKD